MTRNAFATPTYKRQFAQADSGAYGVGFPSINYQMPPQQMYAPAGPGFMGMPQYGGDQMDYGMGGQFVPPAYRGMRQGRRLQRFTPYMESVQPFAGIE